MSKMNFNGEFDATSLKQGGKPVATEEYVDEKGIHYFDKFVTGEKLDEQMTIGQVAYCDYGSIVVGGDVPSSVVINFTQTGARAIYLRNIYIRYVDTNNVEQTYDYTFTSKQFSQVGQTVDLGGLDWRVEDPNTSLFFGNNNTYGQQFGSGSQPSSNLTLTTVDLAGCTVKEVRITACGASSTNAKLYVSAGADEWLYHEGESGESKFKALSANTVSDPATFTHGEGSTPGTGETIPFSRTFVKRVDTKDLLDPIAPIESVVYVNLGDNRLYRYDGTALVELSKVLELGNTSTTAYRGDLGSDNRSRIFDILNNKLPNSNLEEITWSDLKTKRDNGGLAPGKSYRITDYQCTTVQPETRSAGHVFDIIVTADSNAVLNENARACLHDGDTYFADSDLASWELKYSLDNDTDRFLWADGRGIVVGGNVYVRVPRWDRPGNTYGYGWGCAAMPMGHISITQLYTNTDAPTTSTKAYSSSTGGTEYAISSIHAEGGKGVVYRMRDEFNNEAPHDFKNIQYHVSGTEYMYTFGETSSGTISDGSLTKYSYNNLITAYCDSSPFILNFVYTRNGMHDCTILGSREVIFKNNVDYGGHSMYVYASTNISFSTYETRCNRVINSYNCVLPGRFNIVIDSNSITQNGQMSNYNYYYGCRQMTLGNDCNSNKFIGTQSATLGASCSDNIFDGHAEDVKLGDTCTFNQLLGSLKHVTLANNARQNIFNSGSEYVTVECQWLGYCVFDPNIKYLTVRATGTPSGTSRVANYRFHPGILGASSSNPKVVTVSTLGADHSIDIYPIGSTEMFI